MGVLELLPDSVAVEDGELVLGGMRVSALAGEFGTPLVAYCEETLRARARAYREAAPDAVTLYGSKAFPNVALLRPVRRGGARRGRVDAGRARARASCGRPGGTDRRPRQQQVGRRARCAAADADVWLVVLDAPDEVERAAAAGLRRVLVRVTPGIDPDTHDAIKTGHRGSKFGLPPEQALARSPARATRARRPGPARAPRLAAPRRLAGAVLGRLARRLRGRVRARSSTGHRGRGRRRRARHPLRRDRRGPDDPRLRGYDRRPRRAGVGVARTACAAARVRAGPLARRRGGRDALPRRRREALERDGDRTSRSTAACRTTRGRSSTRRASRRCSRTAATSRLPGRTRCAASTANRGRARRARRTARRRCAETCWRFRPRAQTRWRWRSNYNVVPRPAAVLVSGGAARLIRRRETLDDLLSLET